MTEEWNCDKTKSAFFKYMFSNFVFSFSIFLDCLERKLSDEDEDGRNDNPNRYRLPYAKYVLQICSKWLYARVGSYGRRILLRHHPCHLTPQEKTGSWQHAAAPEHKPGISVHILSKRHVKILHCSGNVSTSLQPK